MNYRNIITLEAEKRGGRPGIRQTKVAVLDVLDRLAEGMTHAEILAKYSELTEKDILACLAFVAARERCVRWPQSKFELQMRQAGSWHFMDHWRG